MIYYAVVYMKDGQIHLKPCQSRVEAEAYLSKLRNSKWKDSIDITKVVKKDANSAWLKSVKGYWI